MSQFAGSFLHRFSFEGDESLYIDHLGRRIVADHEGQGEVTVLRGNVVVESDGTYSLVSADPGQSTDVLVSHGQPKKGGLESGLFVEGAGWLLSATGPVVVDGIMWPEAVRPIPFFISCASEAPFEFCRVGKSQQTDKWVVSDIKSRKFIVQNLRQPRSLNSMDQFGIEQESEVVSHLNAMTWKSPVSAEATGILLQKTYDRFHGRQRARVLVDGEFVGWWYEPFEDRTRRWALSNFSFPIKPGRTELEITVDPPAGSPLWSVSSVAVYSLT